MSPDVHPGAEVLAAYAAGDLEHAAAADVSSHLTACAACAQDVTAIERATQALGALPVLPMPVDVMTALDAAIDAEVRALTVPGPIRRDRRRPPRFMPFAAAAVTVGLVAAIGYGATRSSEDRGDVGAESTIAGGSAPAGPLVLSTGTDYTAGALDEQVRGVLGGAAGDTAFSAAQEDSGGATTADAPLAATGAEMRAAGAPDDAALTSCVAELAGADGVVPIVVDVARYAGQPAWVVVLPFRDDKVDVFVVRPQCRKGDAQLLYFERVTRA